MNPYANRQTGRIGGMMSRDDIRRKLEVIKKMKENSVFNNYIEYIVFPFYKNFEKGTRINFEFPLTVLVGRNGSGKSSTLHSLYGAPLGYSLGDFWFSTDADPIIESGEPNRFFYGYREDKKGEIKEVIKSRTKRSATKRSATEKKKEDPDYWETRVPSIPDGMKPRAQQDSKTTRESPVNKKVIYFDFRTSISAFDIVLHFSKGDIQERKEFLRKRSKYINRLFAGDRIKFPGTQDKEKGTRITLSDKTVRNISKILGKEYKAINIAEHTIYRTQGVSAMIAIDKQENGQSKYSEANAGSGEFAVIQMVRLIDEAPENSLILLDEPEVSIHPGAQQRLKEYLLDVIVEKKVQIVISTHSPALIEYLPDEAIKLYRTTVTGKFKVIENVTYQEAFFDVEDKVEEKKCIYCEDFAAKQILEKLLAKLDIKELIEVNYLSGGANTLVGKFLPTFALSDLLKDRMFIFLDGDQNTQYTFKGKNNLTAIEASDVEYLKKEVAKAYGMSVEAYCDGKRGAKRTDQLCDIYIKYLQFYSSNVFYLANNEIPEEILLSSDHVKERYAEILKCHEPIRHDNAKSVVRDISLSEFGDDNHINDIIEMLAYQWSLEPSNLRDDLLKILKGLLKNRN